MIAKFGKTDWIKVLYPRLATSLISLEVSFFLYLHDNRFFLYITLHFIDLFHSFFRNSSELCFETSRSIEIKSIKINLSVTETFN
jgi:hypothetical protein